MVHWAKMVPQTRIELHYNNSYVVRKNVCVRRAKLSSLDTVSSRELREPNAHSKAHIRGRTHAPERAAVRVGVRAAVRLSAMNASRNRLPRPLFWRGVGGV